MVPSNARLQFSRRHYLIHFDCVPDHVFAIALGYLSPRDLGRASCTTKKFRATSDISGLWASFLTPTAVSSSPSMKFRSLFCLDPPSRQYAWLHVDYSGRACAQLQLEQALHASESNLQKVNEFLRSRPSHWLAAFLYWGLILPACFEKIMECNDVFSETWANMSRQEMLAYFPSGFFVPSIESEMRRLFHSESPDLWLLDLPSNHASTLRAVLSLGLPKAQLESLSAINTWTRIFQSTTTATHHRGLKDIAELKSSIVVAILATPPQCRSPGTLASDSSCARLLCSHPVTCSTPQLAVRILRASATEVRMLTLVLGNFAASLWPPCPLGATEVERLLRLPIIIQEAVADGSIKAREVTLLSATRAHELATTLMLQNSLKSRGGALLNSAANGNLLNLFVNGHTSNLPRQSTAAPTADPKPSRALSKLQGEPPKSLIMNARAEERSSGPPRGRVAARNNAQQRSERNTLIRRW
jgi:hypothetical protein